MSVIQVDSAGIARAHTHTHTLSLSLSLALSLSCSQRFVLCALRAYPNFSHWNTMPFLWIGAMFFRLELRAGQPLNTLTAITYRGNVIGHCHTNRIDNRINMGLENQSPISVGDTSNIVRSSPVDTLPCRGTLRSCWTPSHRTQNPCLEGGFSVIEAVNLSLFHWIPSKMGLLLHQGFTNPGSTLHR